ncbi:MAG: hypothetical protein GF401_19270 [Chitinivibrionales bacterium]|nr:hypothetical protein [Chitinivibrionales bacterium]
MKINTTIPTPKPNKVGIGIMLCLFLFFVFFIHPFLAADNPVDSSVLGIEGWISLSTAAEAATIAERDSYRTIIITGPECSGVGRKISCNATIVSILYDHDMSGKSIITGATRESHSSRTASYAYALKDIMANHTPPLNSVNIFTEGVHAEKSYVTYKNILGPKITVGVISGTPGEYNPQFWWVSVKGWKWVLFDLFKYIRALIVGY